MYLISGPPVFLVDISSGHNSSTVAVATTLLQWQQYCISFNSINAVKTAVTVAAVTVLTEAAKEKERTTACIGFEEQQQKVEASEAAVE
jgi:hypothetical protein